MENTMNRFVTPEFKKNFETSHEIFYKKVKAIEEELTLQDQMTDEAKLYLELVKNEAFLKELISLEKKEEIKPLFAKQGLAFSDEEIDRLVDDIMGNAKKMVDSNGELSEDELETIVGGGLGSWLKKQFSSVGTALITIGTAVAVIGLCVATGGALAFVLGGVAVTTALGCMAGGFTALAAGTITTLVAAEKEGY